MYRQSHNHWQAAWKRKVIKYPATDLSAKQKENRLTAGGLYGWTPIEKRFFNYQFNYTEVKIEEILQEAYVPISANTSNVSPFFINSDDARKASNALVDRDHSCSDAK